jgi:hypothetical protein
VGAVNGQFRTVFSKISALHSKNAFAQAIIAGDLFADPQTATEQDQADVAALINGTIDVPLPTYFALGAHALPEPVIEKLEANTGELCNNLYFLGKRTTIKTSEGIRIVALGGSLDPSIAVGISKDKYPPFYNEDDARALKGAHSADILITSQWPADIKVGSRIGFDAGGEEPSEQPCIAELCSALKPRYHFSLTPNAFFEREPFFHQEKDADAYSITRFISLAAFNNSRKAKWIYAFSIDPTAAPPVTVPAGVTASPLAFRGKKRPLPDQEQSFRFDTGAASHGRKSRKRQKGPPPGPAQCFFCLSNPNLATHLITSIGTDAYLTTAKGPLTTANTFPELGFPCHILIIPLVHAATLAFIPDAEARKSTYAEMQRYRKALQQMLLEKASSKLGAVTWEVSRGGGVHAHWQFLPIQADMLRRGLVETAFKVEAENEKYPALHKKDVGDGAEEDSDFFRVILWQPPAEGDDNDKGRETTWILPLDESFRFNLQFGRRVLAKLLGLDQRYQWQDCGQTHEAEVGDVEAFKNTFKAYDFSLEE